MLLSHSLIDSLFINYQSPQIDLLVNDDTLAVAKLLPNINHIHKFSYQKKKENRWGQEKKIIKNIFRKYDLSINLTSSDRSVFYALMGAKKSISAIEKIKSKSWWKKIFLYDYYYFDSRKHILLNNLASLNLLKIKHDNIQKSPHINEKTIFKVRAMLAEIKINDFIIFHPSAQYSYKIYPQKFRDELLTYLSNLGVAILITGGSSKIDIEIKKSLPDLPNVFDLIGETSLEEYFALSSLSRAYIGMDTLNMHVAAGQNKPIFAIFGPTKLTMWAPWSNKLQIAANEDKPIQSYENVTIFQAKFPCVACGNAGCDDKHGKSICLENIKPKDIFIEIENWYLNQRLILK